MTEMDGEAAEFFGGMESKTNRAYLDSTASSLYAHFDTFAIPVAPVDIWLSVDSDSTLAQDWFGQNGWIRHGDAWRYPVSLPLPLNTWFSVSK